MLVFSFQFLVNNLFILTDDLVIKIYDIFVSIILIHGPISRFCSLQIEMWKWEVGFPFVKIKHPNLKVVWAQDIIQPGSNDGTGFGPNPLFLIDGGPNPSSHSQREEMPSREIGEPLCFGGWDRETVTSLKGEITACWWRRILAHFRGPRTLVYWQLDSKHKNNTINRWFT